MSIIGIRKRRSQSASLVGGLRQRVLGLLDVAPLVKQPRNLLGGTQVLLSLTQVIGGSGSE